MLSTLELAGRVESGARAPRPISAPSNLGPLRARSDRARAFRAARACAGRLVKPRIPSTGSGKNVPGSRVCEVLERLFRFVMTGNLERFLYQIQRRWKTVLGNTQRCITGISATHNDSCFYSAIF